MGKIIISLLLFFLEIDSTNINNIDSLKNRLQNEFGIEKVNTYIEISKELTNSKPLEGIEIGKEGIQLAQELGYKKGELALLSNVAYCLRVIGSYDQSLQYYLQALSLADKEGLEKQFAKTKNDIGNVYNYTGNLKKALDYYNEALQIRIRIGDSLGIAGSYNNIGNVYKVKKENFKALEYLEKSLEIKKHFSTEDAIVPTLKNLGSVYSNIHDYKKAFQYFYKALDMEQKGNNELGIIHTYIYLGETYLQKKNYSSAEYYLNNALVKSEEYSIAYNILKCNQLLSAVEKERGNFRKALEYFERYNAIEDSIYNDEIGRQMIEFNTIYETQQKEEEIYNLEIKEQVLIRNILLGISLLIVTISIWLIYSSREKAKNAKRLNQINEELIEAKLNAERANRLKSDFLAQMSHEIRTPINTIMNYSSLLRNEFIDKLPEELDGSFDSIDNGANRLLRTIDLILNMSDIEAGSYETHFEGFKLHDQIIIPIYNEYKIHAQRKGLELLLEREVDDDRLSLDGYTVTQLIVNLVDNAIKYTEKGKIKIKLYKDSGNTLVDISDTGIGISKEFIPELFTKFSQEDQGYTRKFEGTGLGLSLAKKYAEINNAEINVTSTKNVGTTFTLRFNHH